MMTRNPRYMGDPAHVGLVTPSMQVVAFVAW